jgi:hypothetical protein
MGLSGYSVFLGYGVIDSGAGGGETENDQLASDRGDDRDAVRREVARWRP